MKKKLRIILADTVAAMTGADQIFTAFDITVAFRKAGVRADHHGGVREIVHDLLNKIVSYERTLKDVGAPNPAWVYHPYSLDADHYDSYVVADFLENTLAANPNTGALPAYSVRPRNKTTDQVSLDRFHRLRVPASVTRAAGLRPSQCAYVAIDLTNSEILITDTDPDGFKSRVYRVDRYGNIRITLQSTWDAPFFGFTIDAARKIAARAANAIFG